MISIFLNLPTVFMAKYMIYFGNLHHINLKRMCVVLFVLKCQLFQVDWILFSLLYSYWFYAYLFYQFMKQRIEIYRYNCRYVFFSLYFCHFLLHVFWSFVMVCLLMQDWWIYPFVIMKYSLLSLVVFFMLKSLLIQ